MHSPNLWRSVGLALEMSRFDTANTFLAYRVPNIEALEMCDYCQRLVSDKATNTQYYRFTVLMPRRESERGLTLLNFDLYFKC